MEIQANANISKYARRINHEIHREYIKSEFDVHGSVRHGNV
jgi:hypothetical protein